MHQPNPTRVANRYLCGGTKFNLAEFESVPPTYEDRANYLNTHTKPLSEGASRMVWDLGGKRVMKLVMPNGEKNQNVMEIATWECSGRDNTALAEMYEHARDGSWLIMEKVSKVSPSSFATMVNAAIGWGNVGFDSKGVFSDLVSLLNPTTQRQYTRANQWRAEWLKDHPSPWWSALRKLTTVCNLKHNDLWIRNWGHRGGVPVILDYGLEAG